LLFFPQWWYISTLYVLSCNETVKKTKYHENTSKGLSLWGHDLGFSNSTFTYSQIYLNSLHCILNCLQ
jgi:hypothetical protein